MLPRGEMNSIRRTLLLWLLVPLISLCSLSGWIALRSAEEYANKAYDVLLLRSASSIAARLIRNEEGILIADLPEAAKAILKYGEEDAFYYQISDARGRRLGGDAVLPRAKNTEIKTPRFRNARINGEPVRICRVAVQIPPSTDDVFVQVAETLHKRNRLLEQIFLSILIPQLMLIGLASLSVWLGVTYGLMPLDKLANLLKSRRKVDLSPVYIGKAPAELMPVLDALNDLLMRASNQLLVQRQFIGNAAHQLRTPFTALRTYIDHARRVYDEKDDQALDATLEQLEKAAKRVSHLINRLLSLARSEERTGKEPEVIDITKIAKDAAANVVHEALERRIELEVDVMDNPVTMLGDKGELLELMTNILENAILYTPEEGTVALRMHETEDGHHLIVRIEDSGPGIPAHEREKIFERFYRGTASNGSGCGLGLAIVSEIAERNQIGVQVLDRQGGGSVFELRFAV